MKQKLLSCLQPRRNVSSYEKACRENGRPFCQYAITQHYRSQSENTIVVTDLGARVNAVFLTLSVVLTRSRFSDVS